MIDEKVINLAKAFRIYASQRLNAYPKYALDFSWPSVGTVDLILRHLRGKPVTEEFMPLLGGAAAYLGGIAHDVWTTFPGEHEIELKVRAETEYVVELRLKSVTELKTHERLFINITDTLKGILESPRTPFPHFSDSSIRLSNNENLLSPFAIGLFTGLCPHATGSWREKKEQDFKEHLKGAAAYLGATAADYYSRTYPLEPIGSKPVLYLSNLIVPPPMHKESFRGMNATGGLLEMLMTGEPDSSKWSPLVSNLALSPDLLISDVGFAVSVALQGEQIPPQLFYLSDTKGLSRLNLRPAIILARKLLRKPDDILPLITEGKFQEARSILDTDRKLGLMPLARLDDKLLGEPALNPVWHLLAWSRASEARELISQVLASVDAPELRIQRGYLSFFLDDTEAVIKELGELAGKLGTEAALNDTRILELSGLVAFGNSQFTEAERFFTKLLSLISVTDFRYAECCSHLGRLYLINGKPAEALALVEKCLATDIYGLNLQLIRSAALITLQGPDNQRENLDTLYRASPMDSRVFDLIMNRDLES